MNQKVRAERDVEADLEEWKTEQLKHHRVGVQGCHIGVSGGCSGVSHRG